MLSKMIWLLQKVDIISSERMNVANRLDRVNLDSKVFGVLHATLGFGFGNRYSQLNIPRGERLVCSLLLKQFCLQ